MTENAKPNDESLWCGTEIPIIGLTGPKASGKTLFASTIRPEKTLMIDCEMSSASYGGIPYTKRVDLFDELHSQGLDATPANAWKVVRGAVEAADPAQIQVVVIDPWDFVQQGYVDDIEKHPERFGHTSQQYAKASGLLWGDVKSSLHMWLGMQAKRLHGSIVLINHLGFVWRDGKPTSKEKAKGLDTIYQLASLYIRLDRSPDNNGKVPAIPAGLVTEVVGGKSRLVHTAIGDDGQVELKPVLPPRIPICTPAAIREYILTPPDYDKLKKGEKIEQKEMTEQERLELQAEIAEAERETEQLRVSRLELMKQAGQRRAATQQQASAGQPATASSTAAPVAATAAVAPTAQSEAASAEAQVAVTSEGDEQSIFDVIEDQRRQLKIADDQWKGVLAKYGVEETTQLQPDVAESIRQKLWSKLTASDMGKA